MNVRKRDNSIKQHRKGQRMRKLMILSGWLICTVAFVTGGFIVFSISGKYNLKKQAVSYAAGRADTAQAVPVMADGDSVWQDGWVRYEGKNYSYNEDILTFLFMGIDKESKAETSEGYAEGGQADALFLLVLNPHEEVMKLIPINRSTMTVIGVYDVQGVREDTMMAQICIQHGYGDGGKQSCEYQVEAVSNLFYGVPINGYLAVDMSVIPDVITLIDGIDLEVLEDVRDEHHEVILRQGEQAHLDGEQVYWYVRDRNNSIELSADSRLARQQQFLTEFIGKVKRMTRKDITVPVKIYYEISEGTVTDISADEVAYLATIAGDYHFDAGQIVTIPGTSVSGEENADSDYDEFYVDEDGLYGMIIDIFYEPVD